MNVQERQALSSLLERLGHVQSQQSDSEIESHIREACQHQPAVARILAQLMARHLDSGAAVAPAFCCAPPEGGYAHDAAGIPLKH